MKLTYEDKLFLDSCSESGGTVWEKIKRIINDEKYEWYIYELKSVMKSPKKSCQLSEIEERWHSVGNRRQYRTTETFDNDIKNIVVWYATYFRGTPTSDSKGWNIGARIKAWKKAEYFKSRAVALKTAVAFGFTLAETRNLLFSAMSEENQNDINPRDLCEMIYLLAVVQKLPLYDSADKDTVADLIEYAEAKYFENVFGKNNSINYYEFCRMFTNGNFSEYDISVCNSEMIEVIAFILSAYSSGRRNIPENSLKIVHNATWARWCFNIGDTDVYKYDDDGKIMYQEYIIRPEMPSFELTRIFIEMLGDLKTLKSVQNGQNSNCIRNCQAFIEGLVSNLPFNKDKNISVFPFVSHAMNQIAGVVNKHISTAEQVQTLIDFTKNLKERYEYLRRCKYKGRPPEMVSGKLPCTNLNCEKCTVAIKILECIIIVLKSIRQFRNDNEMNEFFDIFCNANHILEYTFFDENGVGQRIKKKNSEAEARYDDKVKLKYRGIDINIDVHESGRTYTVNALQNGMKLAEKTPEKFINEMLADVYIYEAIDTENISRGRRMIVSYLDDGNWFADGKGTLTARSSSGTSALFINLENSAGFDNVSEKFTSSLENFYSGALFSRQWDRKIQSFSRNDIIRLCFWDFATNEKYYPSLKPVARANFFIDRFNSLVAVLACCSEFSLSNPHDRILNYCLCQEEPVDFLKSALAYNPYLFKNTKNKKEKN